MSAHRVILAAVSTKLGDICKEGGEVVIRNIGFLVLKRIVRLVYVGSLQVEGSEALGDVRDGLDMLKVDLELKINGLMRKEFVNVKREVMHNSEVSNDASVEVGATRGSNAVEVNNNEKSEANENIDSDVTSESDLSVAATEHGLSRGVLARMNSTGERPDSMTVQVSTLMGTH